jgi:nuclear pore complex protein Nup133
MTLKIPTKFLFSSRSVLNDAVCAYMADVGEGHHEDIIRTFFRIRVGDLGQLIQKVPDIVAKALHEPDHILTGLLPEANRIVLVILIIYIFSG